MPINHISLKNFKCFRQTDISLSQITLLTGENSSGKSSVLYGLLAPFQSNNFPFYLSPNGKYVNMGDFGEMSFNNLKENKIGIDISVTHSDCEENYQTVWGIDSANRMPEMDDLKYDRDIIHLKIIRSGGHYIANSYIEKIQNSSKKFENLDQIFSHYAYALQGLTSVGKMDQNFNFIGPFRLEPERTYYQKTKADEKIGRSGQGHIDQISEWENQNAEEFQKLKSVLKNLGLLNTVKVRQLRGGRFELSVKVRSKGVWASLADVGFGISQFLPVLVADLQMSYDSILLLAQPEIHLHPSIQASLADYFVQQAKETGKQYIIETHSEYLLNRIRLAIVKEEIDPSVISVYYFENSTKGSITYPIEFTKDGQIRNAPQGFFDTYMIDTMDIALHA